MWVNFKGFVNELSNNSLSCGVVTVIKDCHAWLASLISINVKFGYSKLFIVGNVYKHPTPTFTDFRETFLHEVNYLNEKNREFIYRF